VVIPIHYSIEAEIPTECLAADLHKEMMRDAVSSLEKVRAERITAGVETKQFVAYGNAAEEITVRAKQEGVDPLVIATYGWTGWRRLIFGSVAGGIVSAGTAPEALTDDFRRWLTATDGFRELLSESSLQESMGFGMSEGRQGARLATLRRIASILRLI